MIPYVDGFVWSMVLWLCSLCGWFGFLTSLGHFVSKSEVKAFIIGWEECDGVHVSHDLLRVVSSDAELPAAC